MMALHSDVSTEVEGGGSLSRKLQMESDGLYHARDIWNLSFRVKPVTHLELIAVKENLRPFNHLLHGHATDIQLYEDNQAVTHILSAGVSRSPRIIKELRSAHRVMTRIGVRIQAEWLQSAVNCFASRTGSQI